MKKLYYEIISNTVKVTGQTYEHRERLKKSGASWDPKQKAWILDHTQEVMDILLSLGAEETGLVSSPPVSRSLDFNPEEISSTENQSGLERPSLQGHPLFKVSEFNEFLAQVIERVTPPLFWLEGEISGLKFAQSGHVYLDLVEPEQMIDLEGSQKLFRAHVLNAIIWKNRYQYLSKTYPHFEWQEGLKIRVLASCEYSRFQSRITISIQDIDESFTIGALNAQRQEIVRRLKKEGYYELNKGHILPRFPLRIGLMTASGSRAYSDFIDELKQGGLAFEVCFVPVTVQGLETEPSVLKAMDFFQNRTDIDVLVLTRGGGSRQDLRWFDNYEICKRIALADKPVITAIGHFEDISVADEVAWKAEKTPTGAARYLVEKNRDHLREYWDILKNVAYQTRKYLDLHKEWMRRWQYDLMYVWKNRLDQEFLWLDTQNKLVETLKNHWIHFLSQGFLLFKEENEGQRLTMKDYAELKKGSLIRLESYDLENREKWIFKVKIQDKERKIL